MIVDPPAAGAWNMAVDEAILDSYAGAAAPPAPTLRLYGWERPTLSLGRTESGVGLVANPGIAVVRRPTGGGTVLHDRERTYAVAGRLRAVPFVGGVLDTYERIAAALADALRRLGADAQICSARSGGRRAGRGADKVARAVCFESLSSHEIAVGGRKLIGSAQLRRRGAFLQHGSIPLAPDAGRLERAVGRPTLAARFTDLQSVLGRNVEIEELDAALILTFELCFAVKLIPGARTEAERERATRYLAGAGSSIQTISAGRPSLPTHEVRSNAANRESSAGSTSSSSVILKPSETTSPGR